MGNNQSKKTQFFNDSLVDAYHYSITDILTSQRILVPFDKDYEIPNNIHTIGINMEKLPHAN
jgi:hypothetical protein